MSETDVRGVKGGHRRSGLLDYVFNARPLASTERSTPMHCDRGVFRKQGAGVVALFLGLVVSACGSEDQQGQATSTSSSVATSVPASTAPPTSRAAALRPADANANANPFRRSSVPVSDVVVPGPGQSSVEWSEVARTQNGIEISFPIGDACSDIDHIGVHESSTQVRLAVIFRRGPEDMVCAAVFRGYQIASVRLTAPVGTRELVHGSVGP